MGEINYVNIDKKEWERKDLFEFYNSFDFPCFSLTFNIECEKLWNFCKKNNRSFFIYCFYNILRTLNSIDNFRYRERNGEVILYEKCNGVCAIDIGNNLFKEVEFEYFEDFNIFYKKVKEKIKEVKKDIDAKAGENDDNPYIISCVPWLDFVGYTPSVFKFKQSSPCITFGKYKDGNIPLSLKASHCFVDGMHVKLFLSILNDLMQKSIYF